MSAETHGTRVTNELEPFCVQAGGPLDTGAADNEAQQVVKQAVC